MRRIVSRANNGVVDRPEQQPAGSDLLRLEPLPVQFDANLK